MLGLSRKTRPRSTIRPWRAVRRNSCGSEFSPPGLGELRTTVASLSWSHHRTILGSSQRADERYFYMVMAVGERCSVRELRRQIDSALFLRYMSVKRDPEKCLPGDTESGELLPLSCPGTCREPCESVACVEADVARRDVRDEDSEPFQRPQDALHLRPPVGELLLLFGLPFRQDSFRIVGRPIQVGSRKIQHVRCRDRRHLDDQQAVVVTQPLGNLAAADLPHGVLLQSQVPVAIQPVSSLAVVLGQRARAGKPRRVPLRAASRLRRVPPRRRERVLEFSCSNCRGSHGPGQQFDLGQRCGATPARVNSANPA